VHTSPRLVQVRLKLKTSLAGKVPEVGPGKKKILRLWCFTLLTFFSRHLITLSLFLPHSLYSFNLNRLLTLIKPTLLFLLFLSLWHVVFCNVAQAVVNSELDVHWVWWMEQNVADFDRHFLLAKWYDTQNQQTYLKYGLI
jgi:hypothetical protein